MGRLRALIVDDDPQFQYLLHETLKTRYETVVATSGLDALLKVQSAEPDVLLVDVAMPVMDGLEFVRRFRQIPSYENTLVIFLSVHDRSEEIERAYHSGGNIYLTKPIDPDRLLFILERLIVDRNLRPRMKSLSIEALAQALPNLVESGKDPALQPETTMEAELREERNRPSGPAASVASASEVASPGMIPPVSYELPPEVAPDHRAEQESAANDLLRRERTARILLADGNQERRRALNDELSRQYEVVLASDGLEAVGHAFHWRPDIFVLDWTMPGVSGLQLVRVIKAADAFRSSPLVVISAPRRYAEAQRLLQLGASGFLADPVSPADLISLVRHLATGVTPRSGRPALRFEVPPPAERPAPRSSSQSRPARTGGDSMEWHD